MTVSIEQVVNLIPEWRGRTTRIQTLSGGLTNTNYRVEVDGKPYFVRVPGASTELLAIDRENEVHNSIAAAEAGVAPRVVHHLPEQHVMVLEFIEGVTKSIASMQSPGVPGQVAASLKRLHGGRRFLRDFDMFRLVEFYLQIADQQAVRIPPGYRERLSVVADIEAAIRSHPQSSVPCNNDLLPENFIDDGQRLVLVDFEYSGNNDPCFELGNTCQEARYDEARYVELCAAYFGEARPSLLGRMHLFAIMSDVGWTLWGAIQSKISTLDFDFSAYTLGRWERAQAMLDSVDFPAWLRAAGRGD
ncbi:MAG: phosphotransferase [Anaerolineales bacterium]